MHHRNMRAMALIASFAVIFAPTGPIAARDRDDSATKTPIKHLVVIFQENVSFDHYFGTYPHSANLPGETPFHAKDDTPRANNLEAAGLLSDNPNLINPFRLPPSVPVTCDQDHNYNDEQTAFHGGLMDEFVQTVGVGDTTKSPCIDFGAGKGLVMGYYDGNTATAIWNYAQQYAMSDSSFGTTFGPSTPGAVNLISGNTYPATLAPKKANGSASNPAGQISGGMVDATVTVGAVVGDPRPHLDDCTQTTPGLAGSNQITMGGQNVGDLLNAKHITWGWFHGGFGPTGVSANGLAVCGQHHTGLAGDDAVTQSSDGDYIPHHEPFQYYPSTVNPHHAGPSDARLIGTSADGANHQYDLTNFFTALNEGRLPAVSFLKASAYQDGHAGYSDPIDEQIFLVNTINTIMQSKEWRETAIVISYDDSDGWYDHVMGPIVNQSNSPGDDQLLGNGNCGTPKPIGGTIQNGRCGYGPRLPLLIISPWAKSNYIDHRVTDQSSILRFIEDNWDLGRIGNGSTDAIAGKLNGMFDFDEGPRNHAIILDPTTGQRVDQ